MVIEVSKENYMISEEKYKNFSERVELMSTKTKKLTL